jgi:hypothetical protein
MPDIYDDPILRAAIGLFPLDPPTVRLHALTVPRLPAVMLAMTDRQCRAYRALSPGSTCRPCDVPWKSGARQ